MAILISSLPEKEIDIWSLPPFLNIGQATFPLL
jgi:hypothetical protein